jgi:hypothetical protein
VAEQKNAPELPIGRFLKSKSLGGNRVILVVRRRSARHEKAAKRQQVRNRLGGAIQLQS